MTSPTGDPSIFRDPEAFSAGLYACMARVIPAVAELDLMEFRYALENVTPPAGWAGVDLAPMAEIEAQVNDSAFYRSIQLNPPAGLFDAAVLRLTQMLLVGWLTGAYPEDWIERHFTFDVRGFYFLHRTNYYSEAAVRRFGGRPYRCFDMKQAAFDSLQSVGYPAFQAANAEIDACFSDLVLRLVQRQGTPALIGIAGPTAAGKTEITARLRETFERAGRGVTTFEMDHFLTDRDEREALGIDSLGKGALHFDLLLRCLQDLCAGKKIVTPRYDFISATSSHTRAGRLKPGCAPMQVEPAEIIFIEGNSPFLFPEVAPWIGVKAVYLTDDAVRLKRKWKRDMDYRKKYALSYFLNRYFREQFLMAESAYIPQIERCDLLVDTTNAALWATPALVEMLQS